MGMSEEQNHFNLLRQRAEQALQGKEVEVSDLSSKDIQFLLQELQVHQAELAIQNTELRQVQEELEASRDMYADLYNFAPAGACTINRNGKILEANHTLGTLLGVPPDDLIHQPLARFIAREDQDRFFLYQRRAFENKKSYSNEIRLVKNSGEPVYVRLESMLVRKANNRLMIMLIDITEQRELQHRIIEQREKEREKISRDLHDGPVQALSAVMFALRGVIMDHAEAKELANALEAVQISLREQIQILRDFSVELRPSILEQLGLEMAIRSYLDHFGAKYPDIGIRVQMDHAGEQLSSTCSLALFRICQEALQNVTKHALTTVSEVTIRLKHDNHLVTLEVRDNGAGFDPPENWFRLVQRGHLGIIGMRERAEAVGGHLELLSAPGKGTTVRAVIPAAIKTSLPVEGP